MNEMSDAYLAGRLVHWGLQPKQRPVANDEYEELLNRFQDNDRFRDAVTDFAAGLSLEVLGWSNHGIVLGPKPESVFALSGASFHNGSYGEERLLDGLVQVGIAATVFPTAQELEQDAEFVRPAVTADEVAETLNRVCDQFKEMSKCQPDPIVSEEEAGLEEAWRLYLARRSAHKTNDNRFAPKSCRRVIERNLNRLVDFGCFIDSANEEDAFQSTWHYHVLVKEMASSSLYQHIMEVQTLAIGQDSPEANRGHVEGVS